MVVANLQHWKQWCGVGLVLFAVVAVEMALLRPGERMGLGHVWQYSLTAALILLQYMFMHRARKQGNSRLGLSIQMLVALLFALPLMMACMGKLTTSTGFLLEVSLAQSLRNLCLALAVLWRWPRFLNIALLISLFLVIFAMVQQQGQPLAWCLVGYLIAGCNWLFLHYWGSLAFGQRGSIMPWRSMMTIALFLGAILAVGLVGPAQAAQALWGWLPSSGGRDDYDPFSRGGVNTGDDVVRGSRDSRSSGMTDSDYFLDSPDDSLYDVTSDIYGDVIKPRDWQRAIAMPVEKMLKKELIPSESLEASREFSLLRKPPPPSGEMESHGASAMLYLQGRAPAHLRVVAYDLFDGILWSEAAHTNYKEIVLQDRGAWMKVKQDKILDLYAQSEQHTIKIGKLKTEALPFPAHVTRFRVGKVDQPNFFGWAQEQILRMADRRVPPGTVTQVESQTIDPVALCEGDWNWDRPNSKLFCLSLPANDALEARLMQVATEWVGDLPRGWPQIEAISHRLRSDFTLNRKITPPVECRDTVSWFLNGRVGRDVDFATTAVLMLRVLGYPARLVSGWYAHPDHFDQRTEHTLIYKDDVHFWPEVLVHRQVWVGFEPTPGYELAGPVYSWRKRLGMVVEMAMNFCVRHPWLPALILTTLALLLWYRHTIMDRLRVIAWHVWRDDDPRHDVRRTLQLIDARTTRYGLRRPRGETPSRWYTQLVQDDLAKQWAHLLQWYSYAPQSEYQTPWPRHEVCDRCTTVLHTWNTTYWQQLTYARKHNSSS